MKGTGLRAPRAEETEPFYGSGEYRQSPWTSPVRKVLVADPSGALCHELRPLLADAKLELASAKDGHEAWKNLVVENPELIISDTDLPGMNGMDLCRAVRSSAWLGRTPFVLIADQAHREILTMATECGADLCLLKPVDPARLADLVRALLK